jgi:hypothetical protein
MREIPERVQEGSTIVAYVVSEEVPRVAMHWSTSRGNGGMMGTARAEEVPLACPPGGGFSCE